MKYAVISDVHGNYEALKEVLSFINKEQVDRILNCGDIVGYGPDPNRCINEIKRDNRIFSIAGNHDSLVAFQGDLDKYNEAAAYAIKWTREHVTEENIKFLQSLEYISYGRDYVFVHGSLRDPLNEYILGINQAAESFKKMKQHICFSGHTHEPAFFRFLNQTEQIKAQPEVCYKIEDQYKYIVNPGSIGQPRDGDPRAGICIYDSAKKKIVFCRIDYNIKATQRKIEKAGLPDFLSYRLSLGI